MRKSLRSWSIFLTITCCLGSGLCARASQAQDLFEQAVEESAQEVPPEQRVADNEQRADSLYFSGRFVVDDKDPVKSVPSVADQNANPVDFGLFLTALFQKGSTASERGEHASAVKYFLALAQGTPQGAMAFRHLCAEYRALGRVADAQKACGFLLSRNGVTLDDSVQFVQLVVTQPEELTPAQVTDLEAVIAHVAEQTNDKALAEDLKCRLGARILDLARLEACTTALRTLGYPEGKMSTYVWALAMLRGNTDEAKRQVELVQKTTADVATISAMSKLTSGGGSSDGDMQLVVVSLMAVLMGAAAILYLQQKRKRAGSYGS